MTAIPRPKNQCLPDIKLFLALQIMTVPLVMMIFRWIEPRIVAAVLAGAWFCVSSGFIVFRSFCWPHKWKSPVFWTSLFFSAGIAFPMLTVRAFNWAAPFDQLSVWGIPGPLFHRASNLIFLVMVGATIWEFRKQRKLKGK